MKVDRLTSRMMAAARRTDNPCIRCGSTGSTCGRHYNGAYQHQLGKGRGIKCHAFAVADFCNACDAEFQEGAIPKPDVFARTEKSEEFLFWCLMTLIRREEMGVLKL